MASPEWLEIFRSYEPPELAEHITQLKKQVSVFSSQTVGSKSYVKDLAQLQGQLSAAIRVQNERKHKADGNHGCGVTDFSQI